MRLLILLCSVLIVFAQPLTLIGQDPNQINAQFDQMRLYNRFGNKVFGVKDPVMDVLRSTTAAPDAAVPKEARSRFEKGNKLLDKGEVQKAVEQFEAAIAAYPDYASAHNNLGVTALFLGDLDRAEKAFQLAAKLDPQLTSAHINLGLVKIQRQHFTEAETPLRTANRLDPQNLKTLTLLAYVEALNKEYDDAILAGRRVHAFPNHKPFAFAHMVTATALQSAGRTDEAIAEYKLFLQEDPANPRAPVAQQALQILQGGSPSK